FEGEAADKARRPRAETERRLAQPQILPHRQRGEADIDAIEVADEIQQARERQDAPVNLAHRALLDSRAHHSSRNAVPRLRLRLKVSGTALYLGASEGFFAGDRADSAAAKFRGS